MPYKGEKKHNSIKYLYTFEKEYEEVHTFLINTPYKKVSFNIYANIFYILNIHI